MTTMAGRLRSYNKTGMKKQWIIVAVLSAVVAVWLYLTADCVFNRASSGMPVDWANIKDCGY